MTDEQSAIEFSTAGCKTMADDTLRLQVDIDPRFADKAFELFGKRGIHGAIVRLNLDPTTGRAPEPDKPQHGPFWRDLIAAGFFRSPPVLRAIGPESKFEDWIRTQPSVLDGNADYDTVTGEIRNECCHVRRVAEGSGTATKPPYFAVPMTHEQHQHQHQHGEASVIAQYRSQVFSGVMGGQEHKSAAGDWFAKRADHYRADWASRSLAEKLKPDYRSRGEVSPDQVREWVQENDLWQYLPERLRG